MRLITLLLLFSLICIQGYGQSTQLDNYKQELRGLSGDAYFAKANEIAEQLSDSNASESLELLAEILKNPELSNYSEQHALTYYLQGSIYNLKGDYNESEESFRKASGIITNEDASSLLAKIIIGDAAVKIRKGQYDDAKTRLDSALIVLDKNPDESTLAKAHLIYGSVEDISANDDKAKSHYDTSINIYRDIGDKKGESDVMYRMAVLYLVGYKNEEKALEYFTDGREIKEQIGDDKGLANYNLSLGILHEEKGNYQTALDYYAESLEGYTKIADKANIAKTYNNIGVAYVDWGKYDSARVYHTKSAKMHLELDNPIGIIRSQSNLGEVLMFQEEYDKALEHYHVALAKSQSTKRNPMLGSTNNNIADVFLKLNQLDSAKYYLNESLKAHQASSNYFSQRHTYKNLSSLEEKSGNYDKALQHFKTYKEIQDSLFTTRKTRELAEVQAKYDTAKQEKTISELEQKNKTQRLWQNIYAVGALFALILAGFIFQFFRFRNKKNKELLAIEGRQIEQLEEMNRLKSRFFNNISHEFRTPLTLILGPLEKLRQSADEASKPVVDMIDRNGKRLLKLINQLLELSKIEDGKTVLKTTYIDLVPFIKGWVLSFQSMAEMKDVELKIDSENDAYHLFVDKEKVEEIIVNLLSNALKYTPSGGKVSVQLNKIDEDEVSYLNIEVSDSGKGIPEEEQEYIFDRFYQATNADSDNVVGTGIGLSLVKELVDLHKGTITVESKLNLGSTFTVKLPFGKSHLSEENIQMISTGSDDAITEAQKESFKKQEELEEIVDESLPILLLIEDNDDLRVYVKSIVQEKYQVKEAINGEEGIAQAFEHVPDIIVSDLMMPKVDGLQVCNTLKEDMRTSHIPIILLTARSSKEDRIEGLKNRADDYLTKPFDSEELLVRIENLITLRKKIHSYFNPETDVSLMPKKLKLNSIDGIFIEKITSTLESEISNPLFGVEQLATAVSLSRSQLFRKMKAITNRTPNEYIRFFRLHRAMDMIKSNSATITEIAYEVGFQNPSYFSKCFQEQFGKNPSEVNSN